MISETSDIAFEGLEMVSETSDIAFSRSSYTKPSHVPFFL